MIAAMAIAALLMVKLFLTEGLEMIPVLMALLVLSGTIISLLVSYYVYDRSGIYELNWLNNRQINTNGIIVNINAGFDETSVSLTQKYPQAELLVYDFYDPQKHTEISIERARKAYPPFPGTKTIDTTDIPLKPNDIDHIFLIFAAHEIRNEEERIIFFNQLQKTLKPGGTMIVTEHLRDLSNFLAYNFGYFHFFSRKTWEGDFKAAELEIADEFKITPFITTFILKKNGA